MLVKEKHLFYNSVMDVLDKLKVLSLNMPFEAAEDVTCISDPQGNENLDTLKERFPVTHAHLPNGKTIPLLKTMQTSVCENDCNYCCFRSGRDTPRASLTPDELASAVVKLSKAGVAKGVFLSSGIIGGGIRTQDRIIATAEILREKYHYQDYIHLKIMPGAEKDQIFRAMQLADRVSINLEGPNESSVNRLAPHKLFLKDLLTPLQTIEEIRREYPSHLGWKHSWPSSATQFVVGAVNESDLDLLHLTYQLQSAFRLKRAYFSGFTPVINTPLENRPRSNPWRQHRLYQAFFLLRDYHFNFEEMVFNASGNLDLEKDPKLLWAEQNLLYQPVEINQADYQQLIKIPGIGAVSAQKICVFRKHHKIRDLSTLHNIGISTSRASKFILLDGHRPSYQPELF
jgi:predicted DNA-binding helix-hairpin-helix protein